jgi:hypothetical protein
VATAGRRARRLAVRIDPTVWEEEVGRFAAGSPGRIAERERGALERDGIELSSLLPCEAEGGEGTRLERLVKAYVPLGERSPSERPFGFVFSPAMGREGPYVELVAFGERHPTRSATRSVYERAHKRLHGATPTSSREGERGERSCRETEQYLRPAERRALVVGAAAPNGTAAEPSPRRRSVLADTAPGA